MRQHHILVFLIAASLSAALAHPAYYHERNIAHTCTEHPSKAVGGHLPPVTDTNIVVKATRKGLPVTEVCPGDNYTLSVSFSGDQRGALLTVSGGTLKGSNVPGCANAITTKPDELVTGMTSRWSVPCSLLGRVEVKVTSSNSSTGPFLKGSAGFSVLPGSKCPRFSKCKAGSSGQDTPAPAAATDDDDSTSSSEETQETNTFDNSDAAGATPRKHPSSDQQGGKDDKSSSSSSDNSSAVAEGDEDAADVGASRPLFFTLNPADQAADDSDSGNGSVGVGALRSGRMCTPSNLGYQCSGNVAEGVVIHYSFGGMPPVNVCTNKTTMDRASRNSSSLMHFAIETEQQGYVSLGFPLAPGRMVPADTVLGRLDNATGAVKVSSYRLTGTTAAGIKLMPGWATAVGAVRRYRGTTATGSSSNSRGSSVHMLVCFSRPATAKASIVPNLDPSMVPLIWASHGKDSFNERHDKDGSLIVNMLSGQHAVLNQHDGTTVKPRYIAQIAHGATMIAAFCLMMPAAGLIARHRWIFTSPDEGYDPSTGGGWLALHFFMQLLSAAAAIVSYLMAMLLWFRQNSLGFERHLLYAPHCELGTGVMAMVAVQIIAGFMRSCIPEHHWGAWRTMHSMWGWATVVAGGTNCVLGTLLVKDLLGMPWLVWLLPVVCSLGTILVAGLFLELPRLVRVKEGPWSSGFSDIASEMTYKYRKSGGAAAIDIGSRTTTLDPVEELVLTPTTDGGSCSPRHSKVTQRRSYSGTGLFKV